MTTRTITLYAHITRVLAPFVHTHIRWRMHKGKEDTARLQERFGHASVARPPGPLFWFHAASIGEALSALHFLQLLKTDHPNATLLFTTGTLTSARLLATKLPQDAIHQFVPVDTPQAIANFFDHWQPSAGIFLESELWPNMLMEAKKRSVPLALVNARMSETSLRNWGYAPDAIRELLSAFTIIVAQNEADRLRYEALAHRPVACVGNLKHDAPALPAEEGEFAKLKTLLAARPVLVAASLHPGEETLLAKTLQALKPQHPNLLTILIPRHPERGKEMEAAIGAFPLTTARRTLAELITEATDVYIADTIGELGLWYRLGSLAFIGGSLVPHGGQNPLEAIRLGVPVMFGPHMFNFDIIRRELLAAGACAEVADETQLAATIHNWLIHPALPKEISTQAQVWLAAKPPVAESLLKTLQPILEGA